MTNKQKRFCEEYLIDLNATQAAIRAGYNPKTARSQGQRMLTKVDIVLYLQRLREEQSERTSITADTVLTELQRIALSDVKITGKEKIKALELLGKHLGLFQNGADNSAALEKLDEVLGKIGGSF
ncbi:MAG: terminase small subunit [Oscillospiraceae bacterium]|nr:terminase small subunit [Oscillospiraceae bacterium]